MSAHDSPETGHDRVTDPRVDPRADASAEGARARAQGRPKDACPHPQGSWERRTWLEGYDGLPGDRAPDLPLDNG